MLNLALESVSIRASRTPACSTKNQHTKMLMAGYGAVYHVPHLTVSMASIGDDIMDREAVLNDTIDFYSKNPRAVFVDPFGADSCCYNMKDGRKCAVGRLISDPIGPTLDNYMPASLARELPDLALVGGGVLSDLSTKDLIFLEALQELHDSPQFWGHGGLTEMGKTRAQEIRGHYL